MLAVSNTSPISNLAVIGRLSLLKSQFGVVWIPGAVASELAAHPDPVARTEIQAALAEQWIRIASPTPSGLLSILLTLLDKGEAEAITLAVEMKAAIVLIDEQEGRQTPTKAGLPVTGVLGILLHAKQAGEISTLKPEMEALRKRGRFFIAPGLEAKVLSLAGE